MAKKIIWMLVSGLMVLSLVVASCGPKEEVVKEEPAKEEPAKEEPAKEEPVQKEEVGVPKVEVPWYREVLGEPKYGGTLTLRKSGDYTVFDPWYIGCFVVGPEQMFHWDYAPPTPADLLPLRLMGGPGGKEPWLAESMEQIDPVTWLLHLRKGPRWWNKSPVNGREFVADDVVYQYHRLCGWGDFAKVGKSPWALTGTTITAVKSITKIDKYTVEWKFYKPGLGNMGLVGGGALMDRFCAPKEAVDKWGDVNDWRRFIATGPWMMEDYVTSSSITYKKNPDYWDNYDKRYPWNKLPYPDVVRELIIPDASTALAAMRTGKIDLYWGLGFEEAAALKKTHPYLQYSTKVDNGGGVNLRCDTAPFTDIRVRKALQMAIDLETLAATYYKGLVDPTPYGLLSPYQTNAIVPYAEWPQELKDEFAYNPERAKALLTEAGYPKGFKTHCQASSASDVSLLLIIQAWFRDIGVDMEIKTLDGPAMSALLNTYKYDQMTWAGMTGCNIAVGEGFGRAYSKHTQNFTNNKDSVFDAMYEAAFAAETVEQQDKIYKEMSMYELAHHWQVHVLPRPSVDVTQPWFKGWLGEYIHPLTYEHIILRWWVDTDLKKSMGY